MYAKHEVHHIVTRQIKHAVSNANAPTPQPDSDSCNCRKKSDCPLEGKCLQTNVIYEATVTTLITTKTYEGLATNFKEHYRNIITKHPFHTDSNRGMRQNYQNMFGTCKMQSNMVIGLSGVQFGL